MARYRQTGWGYRDAQAPAPRCRGWLDDIADAIGLALLVSVLVAGWLLLEGWLRLEGGL